MTGKKRLVFVFASVAALWLIFGGAAFAHDADFEKMGIVKPRTVKSAPEFDLKDLEGNPVSLKDFKGKPILLNFWATWCEACKEELPSMQRLYEHLKPMGIEIVAISIDRSNKDRIKQYVKEYGLTFPILWDPKQTARRGYFIMGLPTSYLVDSEGKLQGFVSGARAWDSPASKDVMESLAGGMGQETQKFAGARGGRIK